MSSYRPVPVVKLLGKMQNMASLILDLAYASVIFRELRLHKEVLRLENSIDKMISQLEIQIMLATRDIDDAKANISFLRIGQALNRISDAAADIAALSISSSAGIPEMIKSVIEHSDERISKVEISDNFANVLLKKSISDIEDFFGIDIIAINRGEQFYFDFHNKKLNASDLIFVRGPNLAISVFEKFFLGKLTQEAEITNELNKVTINQEIISLKGFNDLEKKIFRSLIKLKHKSELSINLAFTALLLNDKKLANEVMRLEKELDHLDRSLGLQALKLESTTIDQQEKVFNLIRLSKALEEIADASLWLIEPFIINTERHPLLASIVQEGEEKVLVYEVEEDSDAVMKTVGEFEAKVQGMWIVAIHREDKGYLFDPPPNYLLKSGETLLIRAYGRQKKKIEFFEDSKSK